MPNTKSARKSLKVGLRRNVENKKIKLNIRQTIKKASDESLSEVYKVLDKAAKNNVIHKNKAARLKSRISKNIDAQKSEEPKKATEKTTKPTAKKTVAAKKTATKKTAVKKTTKK